MNRCRHWLAVLMAVNLPLFVQAETITGTVHTRKTLSLGLPLSGVVKKVLVSEGDKVESGEVLLELDCRAHKLEAKIARARADALSVAARRVRAALNRTLEMYDQDLIAAVEMQAVHDRHDEADANLRQEDARARQMELQSDYCTLRAPSNGWVSAVYTNPGAVIAGEYAANKLVDLQIASPEFVMVLASASSLPIVGKSATLIIEGHRLEGVIVAVYPHPAGLRVLVLPDSAGSLKAGQSVTVEF